MKKSRALLIGVLTAILFQALVFITPVIVGLSLPSQYSNTYYAELSPMYQKLKKCEKKKIVLLGNSSVAFGINQSVLKMALPDYEICPFGLYGALGTKLMMDLALPQLKEGDVVVLSPEINDQSMSLFFSGEEVWKSADDDHSIAFNVANENKETMVATYFSFLKQKMSYVEKGAPDPDGVYKKSSFDDDCQMIYEREYNIMPGYYDENDMLSFSPSLVNEEFMDYVNSYYETCVSKKVSFYYNYCPVNLSAVTSSATLEEFFEKLNDSLECPILGNLEDYLMEQEWFYDSNFHLNTSGSFVYSYQLAKDLKPALGDYSVTQMELPDKPEAPISDVTGDNSDADCFEYETLDNGIRLTSLTEKGKTKTSIILPTSYDGKPVISFAAEVFQGDTNIEEITLPTTIRKLEDECFLSCIHLNKVLLTSLSPVSSVGSHLLDGCQSVTLYTMNYDSYLKYIVNYYWSQYASRFAYLS